MRHDDWMYDEDELEAEEGPRKPEPTERQCPNCHRWVPAESVYCAWCCKPFEKK